jgi:hypothetical protein
VPRGHHADREGSVDWWGERPYASILPQVMMPAMLSAPLSFSNQVGAEARQSAGKAHNLL